MVSTLTIAAGDCCNDIKRSLRDVSPAHYTLEINSFLDLQKMVKDTKAKRYESQTFEVGGYKWNLCLNPNGDEERHGKGYISKSLVIVETETLAIGWEALMFKREHWRFDRKNKECEFSQLMLQTDFHDTNNGYLRGDQCIFGVEIGMCSLGKGEIIPPIKNVTSSYTWKLNKFSTSYAGKLYSSYYKWKLLLYPKGDGDEDVDGKYVSLFLCLDESKHKECLYADFKVSIMNQKNNEDRTCEAHHLFSAAAYNLGWSKFMSVKELNDESKGFLVADSLRIKSRLQESPLLKLSPNPN